MKLQDVKKGHRYIVTKSDTIYNGHQYLKAGDILICTQQKARWQDAQFKHGDINFNVYTGTAIKPAEDNSYSTREQELTYKLREQETNNAEIIRLEKELQQRKETATELESRIHNLKTYSSDAEALAHLMQEAKTEELTIEDTMKLVKKFGLAI